MSQQISLKEEYSKKTAVTPQEVEKLRRWLQTQPHLPEQHITELDLILTYHCCDYSIEVSKQVLDLHFTLRSLFSNFFQDRKVDQRHLAVLDTVLLYPLPTRAVDGSAVIYTHMLDYDSKNFSFMESIRPVSVAMSQQISLKEEYSKKTGVTPQEVEKLRRWLQTQPHLPEQHITELDLILTYHCCDYSIEVSKQVLDLHFTLRSLFSNFFQDRKVDQRHLAVLDTVLLYPLPTRAVDGSAVIYTHMLDYDSKNFSFMESIRAVLLVLDCWQNVEGTWPGFIIALDMEGVTMGHIAKLDFLSLQQFFYYLQEAMLVKLKGWHFLNAPSFMDKVLMLLRPFMKRKLLDMLGVHQVGSKTFDKYLPKEALPKESGGEHKGYQQCKEEVKELLIRCEDYVLKENLKRADETKRPGKPKTITDIFGGVEGSFKKLDID